MRKQVLSLLLAFLLVNAPSFAAISATTQWDVRTTGSDSNGGGFDVAATGTDRSQQDAAFIAFTDLVIGATTTQATSAAHPFDSTSPGNIVNEISGTGCTVQRAQVVSVSGSTATFDKSLGTAASTCTGNLGGALLTNGAAFGVAVAGNTAWTKSGTYTLTAGMTTSASNLKWTGYGSAHGDNGTKPLITTATNSVTLFTFGFGTNINVHVTNLSLSNTAATRAPGMFINGNGNTVATIVNCILNGFTTAISLASAPALIFVDQTAILNSSNTGISGNTVQLVLENSFIYGTGTGSTCGSSNAGLVNSLGAAENTVISNSIIAAGTSCGIYIAPGGNAAFLSITKSTIANNGGDGVLLGSAGSSFPNGIVIDSNVIYGNGGYGVDADASLGSQFNTLYTNAVGANTSGNYHNIASLGGDVTLTANPFTSSTNFSPNSTAGGGTALKGQGLPSTFNSPATVGAPDIGAVQSAGGGSASGFSCGFSKNIVPFLAPADPKEE